MSSLPLKNTVSLVTGASRGIGAAIVEHLCSLGSSVAFTYANSPGPALELAKRLEKDGIRVKAYQCDVSTPDVTKKVEELMDMIYKDFGKLDILVNNAGILRRTPLLEMKDEDVDALLQVNVKAIIVTTRAFAQRLVKNPTEFGGRIVNIGSNLSTRSGGPNAAVYNMTKAGVASLTRTWAWDLSRHNITVNCVEPGSTDTDMNPASSERAQQRKTTIARGEYGKPSDIANAVGFFCLPASYHITGTCLPVDGGQNA